MNMGYKNEFEQSLGKGVETFTYANPEEALKYYNGLSEVVKGQMADVYREAFGGDPWYEVFACNGCGNFTRFDGVCPHCQGTSFGEAYPKGDLVENYFPHMVTQYMPGLLTLTHGAEGVIGFTTGGAATLGQLIVDKYKGNPQIAQSILERTGLDPETVLFYENETCILQAYQGKRIGDLLNKSRLQTASDMGFDLVCGRTINEPWMKKKERHFAELGYKTLKFYPDGDTYEMNGQRRYFFVGVRG